ncbi:alpha/beta hydrolase [Pseudoxanthomonas sp. PXM02]|uniref:serine aminopeptidase domain-containing protein n=1 Tax=Pseudoxanthomonas sp. PXM02 TaxID=2769294 RepID=UPI001783B52F|nr:alpha/beta fold hydrolase [Pseudoxanthomonas sp. PXM02]
MTTSARPRLCLLPGLDGTGRLYAPLEDALSADADIEVLAYDSTRFHDYPALADALAPALERHRDVVLVTESFAGPLGVLLAHRYPERIRALVMAASFVRPPLPLSGAAAALLQRLPAVAPPLFALEHLLAGSGLPPPLRAEFEAIVATLPFQVMRQRALAALRVDVTRELASLQMPLLYLQARRDRLVWPRAGREVLRWARTAHHAVVDAPHFLFQMAPIPAATEIRRLLDRLHGDARP